MSLVAVPEFGDGGLDAIDQFVLGLQFIIMVIEVVVMMIVIITFVKCSSRRALA